MLSMMVVHTFFFPIQSFASTEINNKQVETNDQSFKKAIIVADDEQEVPLFEKMDEESEKLISLSNEDEVKLLKKEEEFSLIDRKSTRLNSSHVSISYAVFCLKKKTKDKTQSKRENNQ